MEQPKESFTATRLSIFFIAVVVCVGLFLYFKNFEKNDAMKNEVFKSSYNSALGNHVAGDKSMAIAEFEKLLNDAPDKISEAKVKQYLVDNLFDRNQGGDYLRAVQLTEEMINDQALSPRSRAMALNILTANIMGNPDSFFPLYFANGNLSKYIPTGGESTDSYNIAIKMFKDAEEIYPTPYAEYRITDAYYNLSVAGKLADGLASKEEMASAIQSYLEEGDKTIATDKNYIPGTLARLYYTRAANASYAGWVLDNMSTPERETVFKDSIANISELDALMDPRVNSYLLRTKFYYAGILVDDTTGREADIREILQLFGSVNPNSPGYETANDYFKKVVGRSDQDTQKKRVIKLVNISPEFKSYLSKIGLEL